MPEHAQQTFTYLLAWFPFKSSLCFGLWSGIQLRCVCFMTRVCMCCYLSLMLSQGVCVLLSLDVVDSVYMCVISRRCCLGVWVLLTLV